MWIIGNAVMAIGGMIWWPLFAIVFWPYIVFSAMWKDSDAILSGNLKDAPSVNGSFRKD
jgi:hypothetical protein